ncbi:MAG: RDD family protein [Oligoflexus sp.]|nr:RDD family protein [Oligoflexus sp.]
MSQTVQAKIKAVPDPAAQPAAATALQREVGGIKLFHTVDEDFSVYAPASFVERFFATCIDYMIMGIILTLLKLPFLKILSRLEILDQVGKVQAINSFLLILAFLVYQVAPQVIWGQTIGKTFFGIRVVTLGNTSNLPPMQILMREFIGKFGGAITLGFGYAMMLARHDKRCLHDLMCETKVVKFKR